MWMSDSQPLRVTVGRVGRAHGLAGDVSVELRTDEPELRFVDGASVWLVSPDYSVDSTLIGEYTVANSRFHSGRFLVRFAEVNDRNGSEAIRGMFIEADIDPTALPQDEDEYYDRQLVGLTAELVDGGNLGEVVRVDHLPAQDYLIVRRDSGDDVMVPFVLEIVPTVDLDRGVVVVDPPAGLIEDDEAEVEEETS